MKERPILFSAPMVRAILNGTKTQTRRAIKPVGNDGGFVLTARNSDNALWPFRSHDGESCFHIRRERDGEYLDETPHKCPYGPPGDRLWVRETWMDLQGTGVEHRPDPRGPLERFAYAADHAPGSHGDEARKAYGLKWKPSIHMPRAASRITLEITGVRVERLQGISKADALAEGVNVHPEHHGKPRDSIYSPVQAYRDLWESINGPSSWDANPWVWVVEFRRVEP